MAIYHLHAQIISRKFGRSATAACAYRAGERVIDRRTGEIHDYARKRGVLHKAIVMPSSTDWRPSREELWNTVEEKNKRADAQVAREFVVALPDELSLAESIELAQFFARQLAEQYQIGVDFAMHDAGKGGDRRNRHVHFLTTTNLVVGHGLGNKQRALDLIAHNQKKEKFGTANAIDFIRELWETMANEALAKAGHEQRIDRRSLLEQGIVDRLPQVHLGPTATAIERKGKRSRKGDKIRDQERAFMEACKAEDAAQDQLIHQLHEELEITRYERHEELVQEQLNSPEFKAYEAQTELEVQRFFAAQNPEEEALPDPTSKLSKQILDLMEIAKINYAQFHGVENDAQLHEKLMDWFESDVQAASQWCMTWGLNGGDESHIPETPPSTQLTPPQTSEEGPEPAQSSDDIDQSIQ